MNSPIVPFDLDPPALCPIPGASSNRNLAQAGVAVMTARDQTIIAERASNLALACPECNGHKATGVLGVLPKTSTS